MHLSGTRLTAVLDNMLLPNVPSEFAGRIRVLASEHLISVVRSLCGRCREFIDAS